LEIEVVDRVFHTTDLVRLCLAGEEFGYWESEGEADEWEEKESQRSEHGG
jgi:hypothetical protein